MKEQPVPDVGVGDVERVVRRDHPADVVDDVHTILHVYDAGSPDASARVHLAALKLAAGNLSELRDRISDAVLDFRDVVAAAEYPAYGRRVVPGSEPEEAMVERIIDDDWDQYRRWLDR